MSVTDAADAHPVLPRWPPAMAPSQPWPPEADWQAWGGPRTAQRALGASQHRGLEGFQSRPDRADFAQDFHIGRGEDRLGFLDSLVYRHVHEPLRDGGGQDRDESLSCCGATKRALVRSEAGHASRESVSLAHY